MCLAIKTRVLFEKKKFFYMIPINLINVKYLENSKHNVQMRDLPILYSCYSQSIVWLNSICFQETLLIV